MGDEIKASETKLFDFEMLGLRWVPTEEKEQQVGGHALVAMNLDRDGIGVGVGAEGYLSADSRRAGVEIHGYTPFYLPGIFADLKISALRNFTTDQYELGLEAGLLSFVPISKAFPFRLSLGFLDVTDPLGTLTVGLGFGGSIRTCLDYCD